MDITIPILTSAPLFKVFKVFALSSLISHIARAYLFSLHSTKSPSLYENIGYTKIRKIIDNIERSTKKSNDHPKIVTPNFLSFRSAMMEYSSK